MDDEENIDNMDERDSLEDLFNIAPEERGVFQT